MISVRKLSLYRSKVPICIALYNEQRISKALRYGTCMLTKDHTVLPATHTFIHKWNESYLPLLPAVEHRRTLAGTHFSRPMEGRRLSRPTNSTPVY